MSRPVATLFLLTCTILWGLAFIAQKSAMDSMGPLTFSGLRYIIGGLAVLPVALLFERGRSKRVEPLNAQHWWLIIGVSLVFFLGSALQQVGLIYTTVTNAGFLTGLYVFFVPFLGFVLFRTRPHAIIYVCVPMALLGIYFLNGGGLDSFNGGDGLMVIGAVFWALHVILLGLTARATGLPIFVSAISFLIAGCIGVALAFVFEQPNLADIQAGWMELVYTGILSTAVAFTFQAIGQQYVPPANAAIILSAESLFAALGGALILGERLPVIGYAGAALIFAAILAVEALPPLWERRRMHIPRNTN
ncbi:DMT family transporter [Devosia sp. J2-20]|jgi:drug/metabolite transporter (DMT)-like permease|uniref:DMT family transporter n=1 Tax=Devosia litorisediminis TaxID=2829817 RepID=A0A942I5M6_9HYPH|nr:MULTISPECIES: DMT family transporter [Devosia]MBS3847748.1 DMT family transporter [Devosia litorisediminis]MCZ4345724.1 DMT family transporter [Devosia neptuniae]WDQ99137.1 DMT family transporter [Devosia sp. J2-20]|tara:strand:- start:1687 stop:2601 length:915 start_codon:yes stop_codon:yes gene_type:complete